MPEAGKLLRFPAQPEPPLSREEALRQARSYVARVEESGSAERREALLESPDVLLSVCMFLRDATDTSALVVFHEAVEIYKTIARSQVPVGSFDEKDYFLGETALVAATAARVLGKRDDSEAWLDRAEAGFRDTINPGPALAKVTYQRLALRCEAGRYEEVSELAPMLAGTFSRLNMLVEQAKSVFLQGLALKQSGRHDEAVGVLDSIQTDEIRTAEPGLAGMALVNLADIHVAAGRDELASESYAEALPLLQRGNRPAAIAHLKSTIGETLRRQGKLAPAAEAYRAAVAAYDALGMSTWVAYLRVVLAQTLLEAGKTREAEWEILAALPTIDEQRMVPEGFAAVALLRESVRLRKTNPSALSELREYLSAAK